MMCSPFEDKIEHPEFITLDSHTIQTMSWFWILTKVNSYQRSVKVDKILVLIYKDAQALNPNHGVGIK